MRSNAVLTMRSNAVLIMRSNVIMIISRIIMVCGGGGGSFQKTSLSGAVLGTDRPVRGRRRRAARRQRGAWRAGAVPRGGPLRRRPAAPQGVRTAGRDLAWKSV